MKQFYLRLINKIYHQFYLLLVEFLILYVKIKIKPAKSNDKKRILALPYYPKHYPGGHERIADWKESIESHGLIYDVHWASEEKEYKDALFQENSFKKYLFYSKVTYRRILLISNLHAYDAVWIQRAFIPFFPFKDARFEKYLAKHGNITYDFYDADYTSNFNLVTQTMTYAQKITAPSHVLLEFCSKYNYNTYYLPFAFNYNKYPIKNYNIDSSSSIVIGWAGSPENFKNVIQIADQLVKIENEFPNVSFKFVCRKTFDLGLKRVQFLKWGDEGFDYFKILNSFDIGINPMLKDNIVNKSKISFKCLEYMSLGLCFLTSTIGIPEEIIDNNNSIIVKDHNLWFKKLSEIISKPNKIAKLGEYARETMENKYSFKMNTTKLHKILLENLSINQKV
jgi:glycosyltransferase involved in cell wall biosynthesis